MFSVISRMLDTSSNVNRVTYPRVLEKIGSGVRTLTERIGNRHANVLIVLPGGEDFVVSFLSVVYSGNIAVLVDTGLKDCTWRKIASKISCSAVIACDPVLSMFDQAPIPAFHPSQFDGRRTANLIIPEEGEVCCSLTTSGSTGERVLHEKSVRSLAVEIAEFNNVFSFGGGDVFVSNIPWAHLYGLIWGFLLPLFSGSSIFTKTGAYATELVSLASQERGTVLCTIPTFYRHLCQMKGSEDSAFLKSVRCFISSGDRLAESVAAEFAKIWGREITSVYGMTETGALFYGPVRREGQLGTPMSYIDCRIDSDGRMGNFLVKGPNLVNPDGYFDTGDILRYDDERYFFVDRAKRIIKSGARSIFAGEIEKTIMESGLVEDVLIMGKDDPTHGQTVTAYVVPKSDKHSVISLLKSYCRDRLSNHEIPKSYSVVPEIRRDQRGKVVKGEQL